jgi:hypothetical protein
MSMVKDTISRFFWIENWVMKWRGGGLLWNSCNGSMILHTIVFRNKISSSP